MVCDGFHILLVCRSSESCNYKSVVWLKSVLQGKFTEFGTTRVPGPLSWVVDIQTFSEFFLRSTPVGILNTQQLSFPCPTSVLLAKDALDILLFLFGIVRHSQLYRKLLNISCSLEGAVRIPVEPENRFLTRPIFMAALAKESRGYGKASWPTLCLWRNLLYHFYLLFLRIGLHVCIFGSSFSALPLSYYARKSFLSWTSPVCNGFDCSHPLQKWNGNHHLKLGRLDDGPPSQPLHKHT